MKLLFINPDLPYPPKNGGKIRTYSFLKFLAERHDVYLIAFDRIPEDTSRLIALQAVCKEVIAVPLVSSQSAQEKRKEQLKSLFLSYPYQRIEQWNPAMQTAIYKLLERVNIDVIQVEFSQMAYYHFPEHIPVVLDEHNVEYELLYRYFVNTRPSMRKLYNYLEWRKFKPDEIKHCARVAKCLTTSQRDKEVLFKEAKQGSFEVIPNGVDSHYFQAIKPQRDPDTLLFTGTINYYPNTEGLQWFLKHVYPLLKNQRPNIKLIIAGRDPPEEISKYQDSSITITGFVEDIRDCFNQASVAIVPLRIGGGTRLKILEAWAMQLPVVATSLGAEGIHYSPEKDILIADEAESFAQSILRLLDDKTLQQNLAKNGRHQAEKVYDWRAITQKLERVYESLLLERRDLKAKLSLN